MLISGALESPEGQDYVLNLTAVDPESDPVTGWTVNWGDGSIQNVSGNPSSLHHTYAVGPNAFNITASATVGGETYAARVADAGEFMGVFVAPGYGGLGFPRWMTFGPDGNLYVVGGGAVRRYHGTTGAFIDVFVPPFDVELEDPHGIAFGPDGHLYLGHRATNSVRRYDGVTGAFLGLFVASGSGGLDYPVGLTFGPDGHLYIASPGPIVRRYDGATGAFLGVFASSNAGTDSGTGITFGPDGRIHVTVAGYPSKVLRYDGSSGAPLGDFIPQHYGNIHSPYGLAFGPDGDLYVTSSQGIESDSSLNRVVRYDGTTGEVLDIYASGPEQDRLFAAVFGPDGNLYVSSAYNNSILRYSGPLTTGAASQLPVSVLDVSTYSNTKAQRISSGKTIQSTMTISDTFTVGDVNVKVNIDHTYDRDLRVFLIGPSGTRVELFTHVGGSGDNFENTIIDDEARLPFERGTAPFAGTFYPEGFGSRRLSSLDGQGARGTWILEITDSVKQDNGMLRSWSLTVARAPTALPAAIVLVAASHGTDKRPGTAAPGSGVTTPSVGSPGAQIGGVGGVLAAPRADARLDTRAAKHIDEAFADVDLLARLADSLRSW